MDTDTLTLAEATQTAPHAGHRHLSTAPKRMAVNSPDLLLPLVGESASSAERECDGAKLLITKCPVLPGAFILPGS